MLSLKNIKKDYVLTSTDSVHALKGVTLNFRKSEFVSILGPSGCGKTTLMNIIGGLDKYTEGDLVIDGKSTKDFTDYDWDNYRNKKIGFVFQTYNLIPHLTVLANVELALTLSGISIEERKKRAKEALEKVGLHDQLDKKPNQLSGGQMQRVAIARAIVNSPDILLADEPTGALDTATSEQIMELIKEIASDKLVIMVTHNPSLAERYSTRLIRILDGEILSDTDPYDVEEEAVAPVKEKKKRKDKTAMSFFTALSLSLRNLFTKKARTILTAIAGSIGIIGISLILAISNGMNGYIDKMTTDTLSGNPVTVSEMAFDMEKAMSAMTDNTDLTKYPLIEKIIVRQMSKQSSIIKKNVITEEYLTYLNDNIDKSWCNDILYQNGQELNIYTETDGKIVYLNDTKRWDMAVKNSLLETQYDVLAGSLPQDKSDLILVVDEYNRLSDTTLNSLGIMNLEEEITEIDFAEVIGKKYYFLSNDEVYRQFGKTFVKNVGAEEINLSNGLETKISCVVRLKQNTDMGVLSQGINYTQELYDAYNELNGKSELVKWMRENPYINPLTGIEYTPSSILQSTKEEQYTSALRNFGGISTPNSISFYATDFNSKEQIKTVMRDYNKGKEESEMISYTDMGEIMGSMLGSMVNIISYILIAFTSISLVVSSVMIGIITYVSVIERTKEIGILRAIGARKKDITRVFNAETFIIGFFAGIIGEIVTFILTYPINAIIYSLTETKGIASLNPLHAIVMIAVSIVLTLISGLIPALKASKKDPVLALRTE